MKKATILILSLILSFCAKNTVATPLADSLQPFRVIFLSGDDTIERSEILVYKKAGKYYADNIAPVYFVGTKTERPWTTELDEEKLQACLTFLRKARELPEECPETSTSIKDYRIITGKDTIRIKGDCDWDNMDFLMFRGTLFYEKFAALEAKRLAMIRDINRSLMGKWHFPPITAKPKAGDTLVLSRTSTPVNTCTWEFGASNAFKSSCNDVLNLTYSIRYLLNVDGNKYMEIQGGTTTDASGNTTVRNYGATFTIDSVGNEELKLRFLRR